MPVSARQGRLTLFLGPMFAGKSRDMLLRVAKLQAEGRRVLLLKPEIDARYGVDRVVAHSGEWLPAIPVSAWPELPEGTEAVAIDEAQFFRPPFFDGHFPSIVSDLLADGVDVLAAALLEDWRGEPFEVTRALLAIADEIVFLTARCAVCGATARRTAKIAGAGVTVQIGGAEMYEPRCEAHWRGEAEPFVADSGMDWTHQDARRHAFGEVARDVAR